jgi:2-methylcitrate dehydratase
MRDLAAWIRAFDTAAVPPEALHKSALLVLDSIGVAVAATAEEGVQAVLDILAEQAGAAQCQVIGTDLRLPVTNAVLANGLLIRALDYNDFMGAGRLGGHPSDNIAVALSVGEWRACSGRDVLAAIAMGYELYGRLQDLIDRESPWDHVSASGIVAPAIAGLLMGLPVDRLAHALAMGAAYCATMGAIRTGHISSLKMLSNAVVAETGTMAALLAERGLTGPVHVLEGAKGLASSVLRPEVEELVAPCGERLRILDSAIKAYPCIGTGQTAIAAALQARGAWPSGLPEIKHIEVVMADTPAVRSQVEDPDRRHPRSREAADHSFHFLVAAALADGEFGLRQFAGERWLDPAICTLMERMEIRVDPDLARRAPGDFPCVVRVVTADGQESAAEVLHPPGDPRAGISDELVADKFEKCTRERLSVARRSEIIRTILSLEQSDSLAATMPGVSSEETPGPGTGSSG